MISQTKINPEVSLLTVDVLGLVPINLANCELTVRGLGGTITAGKIVDDKTDDLSARNILDHGIDGGDDGDGVNPLERADLSNLLSLSNESLIGHVRNGGGDLISVVGVGVEGVVGKWVGVSAERDWGRAGSALLDSGRGSENTGDSDCRRQGGV